MSGSVDTALGRRVREQRTRLGMSQEALAERAGLHPTFISLLETGKRSISVRRLIPLATALDTTASSLLKGM